jgi:translation initiation factor IF-3
MDIQEALRWVFRAAHILAGTHSCLFAGRSLSQGMNLDLVPVSKEGATPVVCRILDYTKTKYLKKKTQESNKAAKKFLAPKGLQLRPNVGEHDLDTKLARVRKFLQKGHRIDVVTKVRTASWKMPKCSSLFQPFPAFS